MNRGKDPYAVGYRRLPCRWCATATVHDTHKTWLHCQVCWRCAACGDPQPCAQCKQYETRVMDRTPDGVLDAAWLEQAMRWVREGK